MRSGRRFNSHELKLASLCVKSMGNILHQIIAAVMLVQEIIFPDRQYDTHIIFSQR